MSFGGRSFTFFNGSDNESVMVKLSNWSGLAYFIPRLEVNDFEDHRNLKSPGFYMLLGRNENQAEVYFGVAEDVFTSLRREMNAKNFWDDVIVFTSKDGNFYKEHIQYIVNKLCDQVKLANRYVLHNKRVPQMPMISVSERAIMHEYISNIKLIVNLLGYNLFKDIHEEFIQQREKKIWTIQTVNGKFAKGRQIKEGFYVLKNSVFTSDLAETFPDYLCDYRDYLINTGKIQYRFSEDTLVVKKDILFENALVAAVIVLGRWASGSEWKDASGRSLQE